MGRTTLGKGKDSKDGVPEKEQIRPVNFVVDFLVRKSLWPTGSAVF